MIARRSHGVIFLLIVMTALLLALSACGRKGSPKPPAGEEANFTHPQTFPRPKSVGAVPAGQDPHAGRGPLWIFQGTEKKPPPPPPDPNAEPQSILVLPPPEGDTNLRRRGTPNVLPAPRTRTRTF